MEFKDYYTIMGVARDATQDDIKRAYRKLARKYHPDVSKEKNAEARFKEVGEAYEVLKDTEKRAAYDQLGANWTKRVRNSGRRRIGMPASSSPAANSPAAMRPTSATSSNRCSVAAVSHERRPAGARAFHAQGQDRHARVLIELEDAYRGATRTITLRVPDVDAQGRVTTREHTLNVTIPTGIRAGQHLRLAGQGAPGFGQGKAGDLYLEVEFAPHALYRVEDARRLPRRSGHAVGSGARCVGQGADARRARSS